MTALSARESMNTIDKFIREVGATEKTAAEANAEPGSVGGATEHPVKNVDDSTEDADEGFRSKENDEDVKEDEGPPSVDNQPIAKAPSLSGSSKSAAEGKSEGGAAGDPVQSPGSASEDQIQIGTVKEPTGDDPAVETSSVKEEKEDSSTDHPARTDNSSLDGLKYAEADLESMPLEQLSKVASGLNNAILAELAVHDFHKGAEHDEHYGHDDDEEDEDEDKEGADYASQAGYELAGLLTGELDKTAVDGIVQNTLEDVIKTASDDADRVSVFLANYADESQKQAYAQEALLKKAQGEMPLAPPPAEAPPEEALGGGEEDALIQQMLGEEAGPPVGAEVPPEMGGEEGDVDELAAILEELGISPEELEAAMAAEGAGGPEGLPPEAGGGLPPEAAGGLPPEMAGGLPPEAGGGLPPEAAAGLEVEAYDKLAAAKKGNAMAGIRDYIQELITRSRTS